MSRLLGVLYGIWRGLDSLRKVLHLLLMLALLGFVVGVVHVTSPRVPASAALLVKPRGELVEQLSGGPLQRALAAAQGQGHAETSLWDLVDAIRGAAKDPRIKVLFLDLDDFEGADGLPPLEELAHAIQAFRASGKKVIAYGTVFERDQYFLAAQADEIYLNPLGYVLIQGYGRYPLYFKSVLDKLDVDINVFRVGAYKSAVEEYTREGMSSDDRAQSLEYLGALWSSYLRDVTAARHLAPGALAQYVDTYSQQIADSNGSAAQAALRAGLVTALATRQKVVQRLIALVGANDSGSFRSVSSDDYAELVHDETALGRDDRERIAVIVASGEILDGNQPPGTIGGDSTSRLIRAARLDDRIKAVVLRIDSPGGSVSASDEIYQAIRTLEAAGKPVVVSMGSLAASGGYYISAPADQIWASPATITGSIGIFAVVPTVDRALKKVGVDVDGVGTAPLSGQLGISRPLNDAARTFLEDTVQFGYGQFVAHVAAGRHKTAAEVDAIGQGHVWSGADAERNGLVDRLGDLEDAVKAAARLAKLRHYQVEFVRPRLTWAQQLAVQLDSMAVRAVYAADPDLRSQALLAHPFSPLEQEVERLGRFTLPGRLYAYCFCSVR
jgi:protease IV